MWVDISVKKIVERKMLAHLTLFESIMLQIPYGKVWVETKKKLLFWNDFENSSEWLNRFFFSFSVDIFNFLELQNPYKNSCCNKHTPHFPNFEAIICFNVILFNQLSFFNANRKENIYKRLFVRFFREQNDINILHHNLNFYFLS